LQEYEELIAYLGIKNNEQWLRQQLSMREEKMKNGESQFTSREQLNNLLEEKYEF
jgi:hypothetical protein